MFRGEIKAPIMEVDVVVGIGFSTKNRVGEVVTSKYGS